MEDKDIGDADPGRAAYLLMGMLLDALIKNGTLSTREVAAMMNVKELDNESWAADRETVDALISALIARRLREALPPPAHDA